MHESPNLLAFLQKSFVLLESMIPLFGMCLVDEIVAKRFDGFDFYQECDWFTLPSNIQRMIPFLIANTQQSVVFEGYGKVACNFETFKKVIFYLNFNPLHLFRAL